MAGRKNRLPEVEVIMFKARQKVPLSSVLTNDLLSHLIHQLYAASAEPEHWNNFLESTRKIIGGTAASIILRNRQPPYGGSHAFSSGIDDKYVIAYREYYSSVNLVYAAALSRNPTHYVGVLQSIVDLDTYRRSEIYNDYARPQDLFYQCSALLSQTGKYIAAISFMRPEREGEFGDEHVRILETLAPHIRQAFDLHRRLFSLKTAEAGFTVVSEQLGMAMFLLSGEGKLLRANSAGYRLLSDGTALQLVSDRLKPKLQEQCQQFEQLIGKTVATGAGRGTFAGGHILLHRGQGKPLHCKLIPFCCDSSFLETMPSAVVFVGDPEATPATRTDVLRSLYRLTPAESQLVDLFLSGETIASAAERRRVTQASARTQLKSILRKTGTKRQTELMKLLMNTPA